MSLIVRIKKDFGSFKLDVNFSNEGNVKSLLGASGSGKSLTLKCIAGIITPDEGYIELNGKVLFDSANKINLSPQKRHIGFMFQNYALFPNMNVEQNIYQGIISNKSLSKEEKHEKVKEMMKMFELTGLEKHRINQISGGQSQRVALARIMVADPEIILLDEPFSALDEHLRTKLEMDMKEFLSKFAKDVILVTHNRDEAYILSNTTSIIDRGSVIISKPTKELFKNPEYLSAAILTGCKNNVRCEVKDSHHINIPEWDLELKTKQEISKDISYIGIRAHNFSLNKGDFSSEVKDVEVVEQPFEYLIRFRFKNQKEDTPKVLWLVAKDTKLGESKIKSISFNEDSILLLK